MAIPNLSESENAAQSGWSLVVLKKTISGTPALGKCLKNRAEWVVRPVQSTSELFSACAKPLSQILITDLGVLSETELANLTRTMAFGRSVKALMVVDREDPSLVQKLLKMNFGGVILRSASTDQFERAILSIAIGELWASRKSIAATLRELLAGQNPPRLTGREEEVFSLIAGGYTNREIAERLLISKETVRWHVRSIHSKVGAIDRSSKWATGVRAKPRASPECATEGSLKRRTSRGANLSQEEWKRVM